MSKTSAAKPKRPKIDFDSLRKWNQNLSALYLLQGIAILILSTAKAFPVTTNFLGVDTLATQASGSRVLTSGTHHLFDVHLSWLLALFFLVPAVVHFLMATYWRKFYEQNLTKHLNPIRSFGVALGAGIMLVVVGLLSGVADFSSLLMLFIICVGFMSALGLVVDSHNQKAHKPNWPAYIVGWVAGTVPWIVLVGYLVGAQLFGNGVPGYVYGVYATSFVLIGAFVANIVLQYRKQGKWADYVYGERVFMVLSVVATAVLTWQIFAGALRP